MGGKLPSCMISAFVLFNLYRFFRKWGFLLAVCVCLACMAVLLVLRVQMALGFHPDVSGSECSTIFPIQRVAAGLPLYTDPEQPPFYINEYTPLYFTLVGTLYRLLGWDPENAHRAYLLSRLVSAGVVLAALGLVYAMLRAYLKISVLQALLLVSVQACLLGFFNLTHSRQDSLLFFWTTLYVGLAARAVYRPDPRAWVAAAVVAVLAFFTKQSGMLHCFLLAFFLLQERHYKTFVQAVGAAALTVAGCLLLLGSTENLSLFFTNIFKGVVHPLSFDWFYFGSIERLLGPFAVLIAGGFLIGFYWLNTSPDAFRRFLGWAVFAFFGFACLSAFKTGSGVGYFEDWSYLACLLYTSPSPRD